MDYYKVDIKCQPEVAEILIALLSSQPFDTFQESESGLEAFLPVVDFSGEVSEYLHELSRDYGFVWAKELIPYQNWNVLWESNFHPVLVDDFCGIRADFHPTITDVEHELVINPKMAFGTGHHETTHMVIQMMKHIPFGKSHVLDYGCGTGVLAILASRLGASQIDAVDIELPSHENTIDNCQINEVKNVVAWHGTLETVPASTYDVILANINRNVILDSLSSLTQRMKQGGRLVCSGFILDDELLMSESLISAGLRIEEVKHRNNWVAIKSRKL